MASKKGGTIPGIRLQKIIAKAGISRRAAGDSDGKVAEHHRRSSVFTGKRWIMLKGFLWSVFHAKRQPSTMEDVQTDPRA